MNGSPIATPRGDHNKKHYIRRVVAMVGMSVVAGAAQSASLVVDSGAGTGNQGALFAVDSSNGARTLVSDFGNAAQGPLGINPVALVVTAAGDVLVTDLDAGTDSRGALFRVNPTTGARTLMSDFGDSAQGPLGEDPVNLAQGAAGEILIVDLDAGTGLNGALFSVNPANGIRTLVSDFSDSAQGPLGQIPLGVTLGPLGSGSEILVTVLSAGSSTNSALFRVNRSNGSRILISDFGDSAQGPLGEIPFGLTVNAAGEILVVDEDAGPDLRGALFSVNRTTGGRRLISDFGNSAQGPLGEDPVNAAVMASGEILVVDFTAGADMQGSLFRINPANGNRTLISDYSDSSKGPKGQTPFGVALIPSATAAPGKLQFSTQTYTATENAGGVTIMITRTGGSNGEVSVGYTTARGSATQGADYGFTNGSVTFADGDSTVKTFTVPIIDDGDIEGSESVGLSLMNPDGGATLGTPSTSTLTIADNDVASNINCAGLMATLIGTANNDSLNGTSGPDVIQGLGGDDIIRGTGGDDVICGGRGIDQLYGGEGNDRLFGDRGDDQLFGESGNDNLDGGNDTDRCEVGAPVKGNTATNCETVIEPAPGSLQFSAATYSVMESARNALITVTRTGGAEGAVAVSYTTADSAAIQGADYIASRGTLNFTAGDGVAQTFMVPIVNDKNVEANETLKLSLSNASGGAVLGVPSAAMLTITDHDKPTAVNCAGAAATIVGTDNNDTLNGTSRRDIIQGMEGVDVIRGNGGDDVICGGPGFDALEGGAGRDQLFGDQGDDRLDGGKGSDRCDGGPQTNRDWTTRCERVTQVP